ncbi:hypothetical protein LO772_31955 [Yinghuangia sp. ASG 101]|uniref:hypothetical protein n=1 Tax=Yinghuangia sp. ASG 101 TaxID=2896848 RepID=UPI001E5991E4|nr:hypothetical protein [Yinghuangia sp. ASG 101]UGQ11358.1 hypothetical protein LO772_31955 [Yinghuangia sp. ASG 101]
MAPTFVDTDCSSGWLAATLVAGDARSNEKTAIRDGVPVSASANVSEAAFSCGSADPTDADRSSTRATSTPQCAGSRGLLREFCQTPPDAV